MSESDRLQIIEVLMNHGYSTETPSGLEVEVYMASTIDWIIGKLNNPESV